MTLPTPITALTGTWELVEWLTEEAGASAPRHPLGSAARGRLVYAADGGMAVVMMPAQPSTQSAVSYAGHWELDGADVLHHVEAAHHPSLVGSQQRRRVERRGDRLVLEGVERDARGRVRTHRVTWRRVGSESAR